MTTTDIEVKSCPFCGEDDVQIDETSPSCYQVVCPECEAIGPVSEVNPQAAILAWNCRP
jgi:Lar family restriction alleviation protein